MRTMLTFTALDLLLSDGGWYYYQPSGVQVAKGLKFQLKNKKKLAFIEIT